MPGGALQHHVQGMLAEVGVHHARAAAVRIGFPPCLQSREDALAEARDVLARAQRRRLLHDPLVSQLAAVVHRFEKSLDDPEHVVAQHADRPVAIAKGLVEPLRRDLPDVAARGGQHELELPHQLVGAQPFLHLHLQVEELDDVAERLREHELVAARHHRDAARAELAQLLHPGRIAVHVDRLVVHAALGEELLGSQAARAPGLPEDFDLFGCKHVVTLPSDPRD